MPPKTRPKLNPKDAKTQKRLLELADAVVAAADRGRDPHLDIPARSLSNVRYNKAKRFIEMGSNTNRRQLFNLSQAKSYMQTMLVASGVQAADRAGQDDQHPRSVLPAQARPSRAPRKRPSRTRTNATR